MSPSLTMCARCAFAAMAAGLLATCAPDQYREVELYRSTLDEGLSGARHADLATDDPLTLTDAMLLANAHSERLVISGEQYLQTIIEKRRAVATFLPTLTLAPSYVLRDDAGNGGSRRRESFDVPLVAEMAVNPVSDVAAVRAASSDIQTARALLRAAQDTLLIDVARAFYAVIGAERAVEVLETSLRVQVERVRDARSRHRAGVARPLDVSLSESQAAETRVELTQAQTDVRNARVLLAYLIVAPVGDRALVDVLDPPVDLEPVEHYSALAEGNRQELLAAEHAMVAAEHFVESAYGQYFPSLSLNFAYFLSRQSEPSDLDWTSLFTLSVPLFSAGLIEADVRTALSQLRQAKAQQTMLQREAVRDVNIAYENLNSSRQRAKELEFRVEAASEALRQAEGLYTVGLATNLERLAAQEEQLTAELDLTNAQLDENVFYLDLLRTAGMLHEQAGLIRPTDTESGSATSEDADS